MTEKELVEQLARDLTDSGQLIEAGWVSLRLLCGLEHAPPSQLEQMRDAFFAGAQHLFGSILSIMDADREPTEADLERMASINEELKRFIDDFSTRRLSPSGSMKQ